MNNISQEHSGEQQILKSIENFFKRFNISKILSDSNTKKLKGIPCITVLVYLIQLVYTSKSMFMNYKNDTNSDIFAKDVVYRFLNSTAINWAKILLRISSAVINKYLETLTSEDRINAIVVDDTFYDRSRSKDVELLSNVFDHASKGAKYKKGFRLLTLAWTDGVSFIPMAFGMLSSEKKSNRYNEMNPNIDKRSNGFKRRLQAITKAPEVMLDLLQNIVDSGIKVKHVLFDSWFSHPASLIAINAIKLHPIARLKNTPKIMYLYKGVKKTLSQIYNENKKRRGKSKYLLSVEVTLYNSENTLVPAKIVFVRDRNNSKKWIAILTTDLSLSEEEIIRIYGKRWSIEVFFKISKSYLRLAKEFQGLSYDMLIAHTSVVFIRYIILAVENRDVNDKRSLGELFFLCCDELPDIKFTEALESLLEILKETIQEILFLTKNELEFFVSKFISKLPKIFKSKFGYLVSET